MRLEDLNLHPKYITRFWSKVDRSPGQGPKGECWFWVGTLKEKHRAHGGYGILSTCRAGRKTLYHAHVLAFLIAGNELPEREQVLHSCDVGRCVNPDHLRAGTQLENIRDVFARNRVQKGRLVDSNVILRVRRLALAKGYQNWRELHERTGLAAGTVEGIWSNRTIYVDIHALGRIAEVLEVEPGELLGKVA